MKGQLRNSILILAPLVAFPSLTGICLSGAVAIILYRVVPHLNMIEQRKHLTISAGDLVAVMEGLALCLSAGLGIPESMQHVGASRETLAHNQLLRAWQIFEIGQDLPTALAELERTDPQWALITAMLSAAHTSGAPVVASLDSLLEYMREEAQSEISTRIRALAVKSVLPWGCAFCRPFCC